MQSAEFIRDSSWLKRCNILLAMSKILPLISFSAVLFVGAPIVTAQGGSRDFASEPATWSAKSKQIGYSTSDFKNFRPTVGGDTVKIQFLDSNRVAFFWLTPDTPPTKVIGPATGVPAHLHVSILNVDNGRRLSYHEWACISLGVNVAYTASGEWLVSCDRSVTLYSSSFDKVRDLHNVTTQRSHTFISPSGRTFLSHQTDESGAWHGQLRDSATLEVLDSWNEPLLPYYVAYSDHFILAYRSKPPISHQLYVRKLGGDWNLYSASFKTRPVYGFVSDDTIAAFSGHELALGTVGGSELFTTVVPRRGLYLAGWSAAATSMRGDRFAVILDRLRGLRNENLDMYPFQSEDRVVVYGLAKGGVIFSEPVKGVSPWPSLSLTSRPVFNAIALSPDGKLLGVVSDEGARIYALPPTG